MADDSAANAAGGDGSGEGGTPEPKEVDHRSEAEKWKALARKHEANAKANSAAATKLAELENASKTELEKLNDKAAAAEERAAKAEHEALRIQICADEGVPTKLRKYVVGDTQEELEASAKEILEEFGVDKTKDDGGQRGRPSDGRPKPNLRKVPTGDKAQDAADVSGDMNDWLRAQTRR